MESFLETSSLISPAPIQETEAAVVAPGTALSNANQSAASIKEEIMIAEEISASEVTIKQEEEATPHYNGCLERMKATLTEASHLINIDRTIAVTITVNVGDKPLNCTVCSFEAATAGDLKIHMMDVHKRKKSRNRRALNRSKPRILAAQAKSLERAVTAMLKDLQLNEAGKPHNCTHCSYKGATASDLKIHIVDVHEEKKPHNPLCETEKASIIERNDKTMLKDQKIKQGEKPHYCTNCSYKGAKAGHLKKHVKDVHKDKKPHKCTHCTYKAAIANKLKMHIKDVHKIKKTRNRRRRRRGSKAAKAIGLKGDVSSMLNDLKLN